MGKGSAAAFLPVLCLPDPVVVENSDQHCSFGHPASRRLSFLRLQRSPPVLHFFS